MKGYSVVTGILAVTVAMPLPLSNVQLHVVPQQPYTLLFHFHKSVSKIGTGGRAPPSWIEHPKAAAINGGKGAATGSSALP